jgi:hypothetical protein
MSMHVFGVIFLGLPTVLTGHILPDMTTASLSGIRILCKVGCTVVFNDNKCQVILNKKVILTGYKDPISDLWTLPILQNDKLRTAHDAKHHQLPGPCMDSTPQSASHAIYVSYHHTAKENNVKFIHQSLCNPPKSLLLAAIRQEFLQGAPHLTTKAVSKYLPLSPATSKGHMKHPRKGLRITTPKVSRLAIPNILPDASMPNLHIEDKDKDDSHDRSLPNFINDVDGHSIANIFCFGAFADKTTGVIYNDCTGEFPFMSLYDNVCFL